ncbi:hypothetical protein B0I37DRAFT_373738 [Chaetomium sp. MPI-CAGE-AT-0009]|nr:hypothetical protein B0I37DRAFT_373738 [Chaetomium sp. MPI-CAGE-AT-0009]
MVYAGGWGTAGGGWVGLFLMLFFVEWQGVWAVKLVLWDLRGWWFGAFISPSLDISGMVFSQHGIYFH